MVKLVVNVDDTNMWEQAESEEAIIETDMVIAAGPTGDGTGTFLVWPHGVYMAIGMPYESYKAIVMSGVEHLSAYAKITS